MKKSSAVALLLGTVSGCLFMLGMCMVLVDEWNALKPGILIGCIGLAGALFTVRTWRHMEGKPPIHVSGHAIGAVAIGVAGALLLGGGMVLVMVRNVMVAGIALGIVGIFVLVALIPYLRGVETA